jgi:1,4-alpha-glucan branching enzyme
VRNFLLANALFWLREYHADGIRVDAVASMLYLDYSREEGQWVPNEFGGNEDLDAVGFLKQLNELIYAQEPARSRRPRSRPPGRASRARPTSAGSASASSGTWAGCTTRWRTSSSSRSTAAGITTS